MEIVPCNRAHGRDLLGPRENRDDRQSKRVVCDGGDISKGAGVKLVMGDNVAAGTASVQVGEHLTDKETGKKRRLSKNQRQQRSFCYNCLLPSLP